MTDTSFPSRVDKFSPIAEEETGAVMSPRHGLAISPPLSGPQTASTESNMTVRGTGMSQTPGRSQASTPSYPFPSMNMGAGTPLGTPALHKPFMALSPTVTPSPMKQTKGQTSREFMALGHLTPSSMRAFVPSYQSGLHKPGQNIQPNLYEVMLRVQSEPGLTAFWTQLTQALKEHYGADRASLAIPSDSTDMENVPWVQMATYNSGEDDGSGHATNQQQSTGSSGETIGSEGGHGGDDPTERHSNPTNNPPLNPVFSRPRLEARHSYAGYPSKPHGNGQEHTSTSQLTSRRPIVSRAGSHLSMRGGRPTEENNLRNVELSTELLQRHNTNESTQGPLSEVTYASSRPQLGRILSSYRPLEAESEPLLSSAGVVRVLDREKPIVLTRDYPDYSPTEQRTDQKRMKSVSGGRNWPKPMDTAAPSQPSGDVHQGPNFKAFKFPMRPSSTTSGSSHSSLVHQGSEDDVPRVAYDDYEQIPASPWSQSPAPSPAAQADPDQNPFFADAQIDEDSFAEHPAPHVYTSDTNIQAIGVDRATSVIHVPLIHPTLSQTRRPQRLVDQRKVKHQKQKPEKSSSVIPERFAEASLSSMDTGKRMPLAILSLLAATNPYPADLAESLENLAPLLATAFYNARQHSNLEKEIFGLARRRHVQGAKSGLRDTPSLVHTISGTGFSNLDSRDREFSPTSASSVTTEYSNMSTHSPRGSVGGSSAAVTPGWVGHESGSKVNKQIGQSPGSVAPVEGYFSQKLSSSFQAPDNRPAVSPKDTNQENLILEKKKKQSQPKASDSDSTAVPPSQAVQAAAPAEEALADVEYHFKEPSLSMLKTMVENGATQQFVADPVTGAIVWANAKFQAYRNTSAAEIHKRSWKNIHHEEQKAFRKLWEKALLTGIQVSLRIRLRRFDGEYRWFHMKILPQKDTQGTIRYWHGQAMDTHDQHMAEVRAAREKEKAASEAKYRALANSNPHSIFAASVVTGMTFANTQWLSYSGQDLEQTLGFGFLDHVYPDDLVKCRFPGIGDPMDIAEMINRPTPREYLSRQESSSSSTGESNSTGTTTTDRTLRQKPSPPGSTASEVEAPNDLLRGLVKDGIIKCAKDGQGNITVTTEMRLKSKTGEYRWHLVQGSLIESVNFGQGEAQWFIACADITDQKHIEAQLKEANDALEKEMSRKMEYLSSMSHEIRTPLNGILGNLQFLTNSGLDEHQQDWVFGAQKAAQGMHTLINDILDVSKAEAKMLKLSRQWFTARSVIEEVIETLMSKASEKRLELCYEMAENVPSSVNGDPGRIKQILLNLVSNAIKFTRHGEVWVKCDIPSPMPSLELDPNEVFLQFSVKDTGSGFTNEDAKLLFKPYSQIDSSDNRNIGGTGLGLILCRTMVELHGGKIWAESVPGKGSTFTFYARFLVRDSAASDSSGSMSSVGRLSSFPSPAPSFGRGHILRGSVTDSPGSLSRYFRSDQDSPAIQSSGSSDPSVGSLSFRHSIRSSASTIDSAIDVATMKLTLPAQLSAGSNDISEGTTPRPPVQAVQAMDKGPSVIGPVAIDAEVFRPPMLSILLVCPQENTRRSTQEHIQRVLPKSIPAQVTSKGDVEASQELIGGDKPITFTHIILQLASATEVLNFMDQVLKSSLHAKTCIVVVTDQAQRAAIYTGAPNLDYDQLAAANRLKFLLKPAKPHKFAKIFDPAHENAQSNDDQTRAEQREKQVLQRASYMMFKQVLGNKGIRALAVEDNHLNMEVCTFKYHFGIKG